MDPTAIQGSSVVSNIVPRNRFGQSEDCVPHFVFSDAVDPNSGGRNMLDRDGRSFRRIQLASEEDASRRQQRVVNDEKCRPKNGVVGIHRRRKDGCYRTQKV